MRSFFSPAIALMNHLGYTRKFFLLALISTIAFVAVVSSLFANLNEEVRISQHELEGITLIRPISKAMQLIQQHRGLSVGALGGIEAMRDKLASREREIAESLNTIERKLSSSLASSDDWRKLKADWEHLREKGLDWTPDESFTAHTLLIDRLLLFESAISDEYALILDPQADSYYLIDAAVNKLPHIVEHLGQFRASGLSNLLNRRVTEQERMHMNTISHELDEMLMALDVSFRKVARYNPVLEDMLRAAYGDIADSVEQITGLVKSDILTGRFTVSPEDYYAMASVAIDNSYLQFHESLLSATETLLKERIAQAGNRLYATIGAASLLLLIVTYFAIGIYYSIIGSVRSMARSAHAFSEGDMRQRVHLDTRDELGEIGDSFNKMADGFSAMLAARKQAEEGMRRSEMKFRAIYESSSDGIMLLDENGFLDCNDATLRVFGCTTRDDLIGRHPSQFSPPTQSGGQGSASQSSEHIATAFKNGSHWFEWMHCRLDGTEFPASVLLTSMELDGRRVLQATVRDITTRKKAEENLRKSNEDLAAINRQLEEAQNQLLQSEKMASIGQLAAGVAHEINNPIGYVYSNLGTLEKYVQDAFGMIEQYEQAEGAIADETVRARLKAAREKLDIAFLKEDLGALMGESKDGITRVKKIVQNLKDFSHIDASDEWHFADLHKGLDSTLNIVHNEIKYKANIVREYGDIPEIECMSSQLNQVFMNLLVNAAHAIEERGTITVRSGRQEEEVWVEIADTGKGIAPEHLKKIFDPFFTTKPIGKGTGLGLSLSYGIVQKHHGRIEVQSEPGKGTTFRVWLPVKRPQEGQA